MDERWREGGGGHAPALASRYGAAEMEG